jgi:hypothetical protein
MLLKRLQRPGDAFTVLLALELGALVRLLPVALSSFPLNDGGLFYQMTEDLAASGLRLPLLTCYTGGDIPFAYPPLGFYLAGSLHLAAKVSVLELMRWLPAIFSTLTLLPFYFLARRMLSESGLASIAVIAFALIPRSSEWMVMGVGWPAHKACSSLCSASSRQIVSWNAPPGNAAWHWAC